MAGVHIEMGRLLVQKDVPLAIVGGTCRHEDVVKKLLHCNGGISLVD